MTADRIGRSRPPRRTRAPATWCAAALAAALAACDADPVPVPATCNGQVALCDRRVDEVAFATSHNAMSTAEDGWLHPNQELTIRHQLERGVRGLMLDVHPFEDGGVVASYLCHAICQLGKVPLADGLRPIREFLDRNRGEVVAIIFESYVDAPAIAAGFAASGLDRYVHAHAAGTPWPTLRALIDADERLLVFTDRDGGAYPWYMDVWAEAWETPFAALTPADFTCAMGRGESANPLFIFNHFLTDTFAIPEQAATVNANPFLLDRARGCMTASGRLPNFVTVDFAATGELAAAVDALNGL